ncbi:hypothetical protein K438DRAFT_1947774 [Mycena galopus ATCC 62051]|nr:hypothetical protein K438DRAFT_1947774 [Mycena galopus ATCC 62051]
MAMQKFSLIFDCAGVLFGAVISVVPCVRLLRIPIDRMSREDLLASENRVPIKMNQAQWKDAGTNTAVGNVPRTACGWFWYPENIGELAGRADCARRATGRCGMRSRVTRRQCGEAPSVGAGTRGKGTQGEGALGVSSEEKNGAARGCRALGRAEPILCGAQGESNNRAESRGRNEFWAGRVNGQQRASGENRVNKNIGGVWLASALDSARIPGAEEPGRAKY